MSNNLLNIILFEETVPSSNAKLNIINKQKLLDNIDKMINLTFTNKNNALINNKINFLMGNTKTLLHSSNIKYDFRFDRDSLQKFRNYIQNLNTGTTINGT